MNSDEPLKLPQMCDTHQSLLVQQTGYGPNDTWQALIMVSQIALFQGASVDPKVHAECGGDITNFEKLGCLACRKPDLFGEIVEAAKTKDLSKVKALGESWVYKGAKRNA